ncbi:DUF6230 family protein, partial [Kitasatospora sp. NPDC101235]|uniref:DUF6230 family protein n=1 Tax=Kitasatospora sp. NPDC101235 TaxID=3364101 RepID=UPI0037F49DDD
MSQRFGRTRWKRFAVILLPCLAATAALVAGVAQNALAASFLISGEEFKLSADELRGEGFSLYGTVDLTREHDPVPVMVTGFESATIQGLCQSAVFPIPVLGTFTLRLTGGKRAATAKGFFIDAKHLAAARSSAQHLDIGVAAGAVTKGEISRGDRDSRFFNPDSPAQQARSINLTGVGVTAVAVAASSFVRSVVGAALTVTRATAVARWSRRPRSDRERARATRIARARAPAGADRGAGAAPRGGGGGV